jgi:hypothetical protein
MHRARTTHLLQTYGNVSHKSFRLGFHVLMLLFLFLGTFTEKNHHELFEGLGHLFTYGNVKRLIADKFNDRRE